MTVDQVSTYTGNYHHGCPKTKESYSDKEKICDGKSHAGEPQGSIRDNARNVKGEMEGRYDKYAKDGKKNIHDLSGTHVRFDRDAYTESRHNEHKDYYTTYTAKGTVKAGHTWGPVSDYALVAKDAKQKVGQAFEEFAKNPSNENRAKLEQAMLHNYKASEAFNKVRPFHWHGHFQMYRLEIKTPAARPATVAHVEKPQKTLSPAEVTAAARDVLRNAYSSRRDGEIGINEIRAEAYKLYVNALSEEFKATGKIAHTNNTPSTPVYNHGHHKQINLTHFAKIKDDTFKQLQSVIIKEKGGKWGEMSEKRNAAFDSHMNSLAQWLKAGGKPYQNNIFIVGMWPIQPIKLKKISFNNDGHTQHFKITDHRRDNDRRSYKAGNLRGDDHNSRAVHHRNSAGESHKSGKLKNGDNSHRTTNRKSGH